MCVQFLIVPHQAQGLFHRHFSQHKYAYDALGLLSEESQKEGKEEDEQMEVYLLYVREVGA